MPKPRLVAGSIDGRVIGEVSQTGKASTGESKYNLSKQEECSISVGNVSEQMRCDNMTNAKNFQTECW